MFLSTPFRMRSSCVAQSPFRRLAPAHVVVRLERFCLGQQEQCITTALNNKPLLGWATITHPYHPLRNQSFRILKARLVAGQPTLVLQEPTKGSFAVMREWTDQEPPKKHVLPTDPPPFLDLLCLIQLTHWIQKTQIAANSLKNSVDS